ncbi:twin-arginine translocation pathway signal [Alcaligenaceae bacterium]|nr:twin-arginine translocation pathway signal [Alcaligenaceae bacterium]
MQKKTSVVRRASSVIALAAFTSLAFTACTTTAPRDPATAAQQREDINTRTDAALKRLYSVAPDSQALVEKAKGVLVFPKVLEASFVVGGEHGDGVLRINGKNQGYYSTTSGSIGLQAGAQSKAIVILFMTDEALQQFRASDGWTAGVDATIAVANIGANGSIDTATINKPVVGFVMTNAGVMAGVSLNGTKINKKELL